MDVELGGKSFALAPSVWTTPYLLDGAGRETTGDVKVLATNESGEPLAIMRERGKGRVIALGSCFGKPYLDGESPGFPDFVKALLDLAGVRPSFALEGEGEITCRTGIAGNARLVFILNNGPAQTVGLASGAVSLDGFSGAVELMTGERIEKDANTGALAVSIPEKGAAVLRLVR